jgi:hypothetical protein
MGKPLGVALLQQCLAVLWLEELQGRDQSQLVDATVQTQPARDPVRALEEKENPTGANQRSQWVNAASLYPFAVV